MWKSLMGWMEMLHRGAPWSHLCLTGASYAQLKGTLRGELENMSFCIPPQGLGELGGLYVFVFMYLYLSLCICICSLGCNVSQGNSGTRGVECNSHPIPRQYWHPMGEMYLKAPKAILVDPSPIPSVLPMVVVHYLSMCTPLLNEVNSKYVLPHSPHGGTQGVIYDSEYLTFNLVVGVIYGMYSLWTCNV